jgi:uncharacterized protein YkwD
MMHGLLLSAALSLLGDINRERAAHGMQPLIVDARLADVATAHASDMASQRYFSHVSHDGATPFDRMKDAGLPYRYAGENIALAPDERTADSMLFASAPHRRNTLSPQYRRIGIGVARDRQGNLLFVEDFCD